MTQYAADDPRSRLAPSTGRPGTHFAPAQYIRFEDGAPHETAPGRQTWYGCTATFVVAYSVVEEGCVLERRGERDEQVLLLPGADAEVEVEANGQTEHIPGSSVVMLPPGDVRITVRRPGRLVQAWTRRSAPDLVARCGVEDAVLDDPNVPPFAPWPAPPSGYRIRRYPLDAAPVAGSYGRVWRSSSCMVLSAGASIGPRDASKLSPHAHMDFQQVNLVLDGEQGFNFRWPWVENKAAWRDDEHENVAAPAMVVIPAQVIHTNQRLAPGRNQVIDLYFPPRRDFAQAGWTLNGDEYPMPEDAP